MTYLVTPKADGQFTITHPTRAFIGNWTFMTEQEAHRAIREMELDEEWSKREEAAWDRFDREYGDE